MVLHVFEEQSRPPMESLGRPLCNRSSSTIDKKPDAFGFAANLITIPIVGLENLFDNR